MISAHVKNFNAGPAALPREVLAEVQEHFLDFQGMGMSILEISHRSKEYEHVHFETQQLMKELLQIPPGYEVLFLQGGASTQFAMVPMNFLGADQVASYVHTGTWSGKAIEEAKLFGEVEIAATSEADRFRRVPDLHEIRLNPRSAYLHMTSNETINGTQYRHFPDTDGIPLIADMSSDILSRPIDVSRFDLIYAGAQKNLGPSGVTLVIVRKELLRQVQTSIPKIMSYQVHEKSQSLYHTPPVFSVYMVNLVLKWIKDSGGVEGMQQRSKWKAGLLYGAIDQSSGFYSGLADVESRSLMNVTFRLSNEALETKFLQEAQQNGFIGLKGHRDAGHLRISIYNAVPYEDCQDLVAFMTDFYRRHG